MLATVHMTTHRYEHSDSKDMCDQQPLRPSIIVPLLREDRITRQQYWWWRNTIYMKYIDHHCGNGVFAGVSLPAMTIIPVWGVNYYSNHEPPNAANSQYWMPINNDRDSQLIGIDGTPSVRPYHGIGGNGGFIAMMTNEAEYGTSANCIFISYRPSCDRNTSRSKRPFMVTVRPIKQHQQLTVIYGDTQQRLDHTGQRYKRGHQPSNRDTIERNAITYIEYYMNQPGRVWPFFEHRDLKWYQKNND